MSFFNCDRCGGAVGLFCHCPPASPRNDDATVRAHQEMLDIGNEVSALSRKLEEVSRKFRRVSVIDSKSLASLHVEMLSLATSQADATMRLEKICAARSKLT